MEFPELPIDNELNKEKNTTKTDSVKKPLTKSIWGNFNKENLEKDVSTEEENEDIKEKEKQIELTPLQQLYIKIKIQNKYIYEEDTIIMEDIDTDEENEEKDVNFEVPKNKPELLSDLEQSEVI